MNRRLVISMYFAKTSYLWSGDGRLFPFYSSECFLRNILATNHFEFLQFLNILCYGIIKFKEWSLKILVDNRQKCCCYKKHTLANNSQ